MHRYELISCHDCGKLHRRHPLAPRQKARCVRCRSVLYRGIASDANRMAALVLGAALTFLIAQLFPIVKLEVNGLRSSATLLGAIRVLWNENMQVVAAIVFLCTILLPAVELGSLLYVTLSLRAGQQPPGLHRLLRAVRAARHWGMTEVLMIGILITVVKMTSLAQVEPQAGLFAFGALTLMLAIVTAFDPRILWNLADEQARARGAALPAPATVLAGGVPTLTCHACGLVAEDRGQRQHQHGHGQQHQYGHQHGHQHGQGNGNGNGQQRCARCGAALHRRRPDSVARTWALLLAAAILYIPANLLPVMYTHSLFGKEDDTIISGVIYFWHSGSPALAAIIFIASIVVPVLKLAALSLLAWTAQRRSRWRPLQRTVLYRLVELVGRWSMLDIFVITLTVALVRFQTLAVITAGPGALAFCAVVVLTMLASMQFDPRLIWDHLGANGENDGRNRP
ncbi:paraquat-inducible protein A [Rugamonas apoptosis]|uniref:paraquat-inducible protein A n=1 Tax=Rugamonas apoptosis TaxID=2758570 RepID=UPI0028831807|nr:paraquat-inducible protein A [Rugamonas apoptosis]